MLKRRTGHGERGVVAVIVALTLVVLMTVAALAVDLGRAIYVRNSLQIAVDGAMKAAAAAALSQPTTYTTQQKADEMTRIARAYVTSNNTLSPGLAELLGDLDVQYITSGPNEDSVVGTQKARVLMTFAKIINVKEIPLTVTARVQRPRPAPVEMVIALDTTDSMNETFGSSTKLAALKSSAKELVSVLMQSDYAKVGLVPFAWLIKLDPTAGYYAAASQTSLVPWLAFGTKPQIYDCYKWVTSNCYYVNGTCYKDNVPYTCSLKKCGTQVCADARLRPVTWDGCVYLRPSPGRTTINRSSPTSEPYYGVWSEISCRDASIITDLVTKGQTFEIGTASYSAENYLNAKIDAINVSTYGGTYIPGALIWAWNMLTTETSGGAPDPNYPLNSGFTAAEVAQLGVRKALVLITDGNNSSFPCCGGAYAGGAETLYAIQNKAYSAVQQKTHLDDVTKDMVTICNDIKRSDIKLYVIALQISATDLAYKAMLRDQCASGADTFFDVSNPAKLTEAFQTIGASFSYNSLKE